MSLSFLNMSASKSKVISALGVLIALVGCVKGCVELLGEAKDSLVQHNNATHWNYGFRGDDWEGVDAIGNSWTCQAGQYQSPINVQPDQVEVGDRGYRTTWFYGKMKSNGTNMQIFNNGHTIQVQWAAGILNSNVQITTAGHHVTDVLSMSPETTPAQNVTKVKATPLQFHFHTDSEHTVDGTYYPLELHIVHNIPQSALPGCPATGCLSVTGVLFHISEVDNPLLNDMWAAMPMREGAVANIPAGVAIDLLHLLPYNRRYVSYAGSLTTPPCTEGLLWHVLTESQPISLNQLRKYQQAVGLKECEEVTVDPPHSSDSGDHSGSGSSSHEGHGSESGDTNSTDTAPAARKLLGHRHGAHAHSHAHRRMHSHGDLGHANLVRKVFEKGMRTGFELIDPTASVESAAAAGMSPVQRRSLITEATGNYTCTVVAYGYTNRNVQDDNGRIVKLFPWGAKN